MLLELAENLSLAVSHEALRSLRGARISAADRARLEQLQASRPEIAEMVERIANPTSARNLPALSQTDAWLELLKGPADATAGARVFFQTTAGNCAQCHQHAGRGGRVGPDLTTTATVLNRRRLVQSILEPSREVAPQFVLWSIEDADGRVRSGVHLGTRPNGDEIYFQEKGGTFAVPPGQIVNRASSKLSVMPEGLPAQMTLQEFRDLLAFLQSR